MRAGNLICFCHELVKIKNVEFAGRWGREFTGSMLDIAGDKGIEILPGKLKGQSLTIIADSPSQIYVTS